MRARRVVRRSRPVWAYFGYVPGFTWSFHLDDGPPTRMFRKNIEEYGHPCVKRHRRRPAAARDDRTAQLHTFSENVRKFPARHNAATPPSRPSSGGLPFCSPERSRPHSEDASVRQRSTGYPDSRDNSFEQTVGESVAKTCTTCVRNVED